MITKIEVDGFKSLSDFSLSLHRGLNIFVGPNGSGKTNIILFFEFLSQLMINEVSTAVSSVGGAGSIFKKLGVDQYNDSINFKIYGSGQADKNKAIIYEYSSTIKTSFEKDKIYFDKQEVKICYCTKFKDSPDDNIKNNLWDLHIKYERNDEDTEHVTINNYNKKKSPVRFFISGKKSGGDKSHEAHIKDFILEHKPAQFAMVRFFFIFEDEAHATIFSDLMGGESFNIVPSKVKEQENAGTPPGIKKDGAGLASTLYAMKTNNYSPQYNLQFMLYFEQNDNQFNKDSLQKIISFLRLANRSIYNLDVINDPFDNKLVVKIFIRTGNYNAVLPLSSMSDGTIKWLTLISAILTSRTIFSIEEPENFLHPWMQAEIVKIMREHIEDKHKPSFVLMTTHSESLLNSSNPEEIIIVDLADGKTIARRLKDVQIIKDEIANSGFGLGSFYFSNGLTNE